MSTKTKVGHWVSEWVSEWQGHLLSCQVTAKNCILNDDDDDDGNNGEDDGPVLSQGSWDLDPEGSSPSYRGKWLQTHHHTYAFAHICTLFYTFAHFYTFVHFCTVLHFCYSLTLLRTFLHFFTLLHKFAHMCTLLHSFTLLQTLAVVHTPSPLVQVE